MKCEEKRSKCSQHVTLHATIPNFVKFFLDSINADFFIFTSLSPSDEDKLFTAINLFSVVKLG